MVLLSIFQFVCSVAASPDIPFVDVPENEWYYEDVCNAYNMTLINGRNDTTFAPKQYLSLFVRKNEIYIPISQIHGIIQRQSYLCLSLSKNYENAPKFCIIKEEGEL